MKRILITGAGSYIGTSVEKRLSQFPKEYQVDTVDMIDPAWKDKDFSGYDVVFHVAGIAHSDVGHATEEMKRRYHQVNTVLAQQTAEKAKREGVRQFIFMSSAIVYGESAPIGKSKMITKETPVSPANFYGESKAEAERRLLPMESADFHVVILRCPMIYGKGSKGNYITLSKFAGKLPLFPVVNNQRSMLYVGNLAEFVRLMIDDETHGIFWPQNGAYTDTAQMVKLIAQVKGKKVWLVKGFGWALKLLSHVTGLVNKAFGSLTYDQSISEYSKNYRLYTLEESIRETEQ